MSKLIHKTEFKPTAQNTNDTILYFFKPILLYEGMGVGEEHHKKDSDI